MTILARKGFQIFFVGLCSGLFLLSYSTAQANLSNNEQAEKEAKQELEQLQKDIKKLQGTLKKKQKQKSKALEQLRQSENSIATATKILRATQRQLRAKEKELKNLRLQQKNLKHNKKEQKKALAAQIRSAFVSGRQEYLKMLLNQEDPEALGRILVYYDYMNKARSEEVKKLQKTLIDLQNVDKAIAAEIQELNVLKTAKEEETKKLKQLKKKRQSIVAALAKEIEQKNDQLTELQINAAELQELIDSVREAIDSIDPSRPLEGLRNVRGKMQWPSKGKIIQSYGARVAQGLNSNGVVISGKEGELVNSIHFGRVVYADWLRGFGLLLIIDHGEGYMSLYGYNQALYKDVGDWVESGETIATLGQSGGQKRPALYFEMRHQGKAVNPKRWLK